MKKIIAALSLIAAFGTTVPLVSQVFIGYDDFSSPLVFRDGSGSTALVPGQWETSSPEEKWSVSGGRLHYTNGVLGGGWDYITKIDPSSSVSPIGNTGLPTGNPSTSSWVATVDVFNFSDLEIDQTTGAGIEFTSGESNYYGIYLEVTIDPERSRNITLYSHESADPYMQIPIGSATSATLRAAYDGSTKLLSLSYSVGGSAFLPATVFALDEPSIETLGLGINLAAYTTIDVPQGIISFDNLNVTAVPEPSTYAAIAGLGAIGFAAWRRRKLTA